MTRKHRAHRVYSCFAYSELKKLIAAARQNRESFSISSSDHCRASAARKYEYELGVVTPLETDSLNFCALIYRCIQFFKFRNSRLLGWRENRRNITCEN